MKSKDLNNILELQEAKRSMLQEIKWKLEGAEEQDKEENSEEVRAIMKARIEAYTKIAEAIAKVQ